MLDLDTFLAAKGWASCALLVASDGVWDLWRYEQVAELLVPKAARALLSVAGAFCELTRAQGEEYFGESADNLTGVLVDLSAAGRKPQADGAAAPSAVSGMTADAEPVAIGKPAAIDEPVALAAEVTASAVATALSMTPDRV